MRCSFFIETRKQAREIISRQRFYSDSEKILREQIIQNWFKERHATDPENRKQAQIWKGIQTIANLPMQKAAD